MEWMNPIVVHSNHGFLRLYYSGPGQPSLRVLLEVRLIDDHDLVVELAELFLHGYLSQLLLLLCSLLLALLLVFLAEPPASADEHPDGEEQYEEVRSELT